MKNHLIGLSVSECVENQDLHEVNLLIHIESFQEIVLLDRTNNSEKNDIFPIYS